MREGAWTGWRPTHLLGTRVTGKTIGIVGFGRIGQAVARRARRGFGMSVLFASRAIRSVWNYLVLTWERPSGLVFTAIMSAPIFDM